MNAIFLVNLQLVPDPERIMETEGISVACGNKFLAINARTLLLHDKEY